MKKRLVTLLVVLAAPFSAMATEVLGNDIQGAKVVTVTSNTVSGHLSVASGRNCLSESDGGKPVLSICENAEKVEPVESTVHYIVLKSGQCLSDNGSGQPNLASCDYQDSKQQWKALRAKGTDIRNVASNKCLTAAGLDKPVNMTGCNGVPAQYWKLPE